ncbi:hypothetical protein [Methylobacterium sp. 391_Methyba4]|uniref:hypothetical protein n=1 Tax=Methylobacterium sp. 391_Methyba4 TaxID=3038924 RepID=UPI00241C3A0D|nr:hypothetical protein [Methylobacterium sp. 391_Methyba4]WFS10457.1 hypothetical protein P9K36_14755 [Methylobacterium sp. 391_Methyba4]
MTLDPTISLGVLLAVGVTLFLAALGGYAGYVTLRNKVVEVEGRGKDTDKAVAAYGTALADLRSHTDRATAAYGTALADLRGHIAETCVKKDDLERIENRLTDKMDKVEHGIRNALTEMIRSMRPRRGDE